jgi:hypothetical protein
LALVRAHLAGAGEEIYGDKQFVRRRLNLANECMQVLYQRHHHLSKTRIRRAAPSLDHQVGQILLRCVQHPSTSLSIGLDASRRWRRPAQGAVEHLAHPPRQLADFLL